MNYWYMLTVDKSGYMDKSGKHYIKGKKPVKKDCILYYCIYMKLKNKAKLILW